MRILDAVMDVTALLSCIHIAPLVLVFVFVDVLCTAHTLDDTWRRWQGVSLSLWRHRGIGDQVFGSAAAAAATFAVASLVLITATFPLFLSIPLISCLLIDKVTVIK